MESIGIVAPHTLHFDEPLQLQNGTALAGYDQLHEILPSDGGDCEETLAQFAKIGIDVDALAIQLQEDGAKAFVKSWSELMSVIESKASKAA